MKPRYRPADQPTDIGYVGEKNATCIQFSLPDGWVDYATSDNVIAVFLLPKTTLPIPYNVTLQGGTANWLVPEYATSQYGSGQVQLVLTNNATIGDVQDENGYFDATNEQIREKDIVYDTVCHKSAVESSPVVPSSPKFDHMMEVSDYFDTLPAKEANKYLGTDGDKKWVFKDGGGSGSSNIIFASARPASPIADALYAIGSTGNYVLEAYHNGAWETFSGSALPTYTGQTDFTPNFTQQTASTANKSVLTDIKVEQIPVSEVENPTGGKTMTI